MNNDVDKFICLTTQEHSQHAWDISLPHFSMFLTQVPCLSTSTFYPGSKLPDLLDHIFAGYLFLCLINANGKTSLCRSHQVPRDPGQTELLQIFSEGDSYDYQMIPDLPKQDQHGPSIDNHGSDALAGQIVSQNKVCNVTSVFRSSKSYFVWHTQHLVAVDTISLNTRSPYCTHQVSICHSNLVTTPSLCVLLTCNHSYENLTCQPSSSYCRIPMIHDTLKNELKSPFTANITKGSVLHHDDNGEHS